MENNSFQSSKFLICNFIGISFSFLLVCSSWAGNKELDSIIKESNRFYGTTSLAITAISDYDDSGLSLVLNGGMKMKNLLPFFYAFEAEAVKSLASPQDNYRSFFGTTNRDREYSYSALAGYGVWEMDLLQNLSIRWRGGLHYRSVSIRTERKDSIGNVTSSFTEDDNGIGIAGGAGVRYMINNFVLIGDITRIDKITHLSAGIRYGF